MAHHESQDDRAWQSMSHTLHNPAHSTLALAATQKYSYPLSHGVSPAAPIHQQTVVVAKPNALPNALPRKSEQAEQLRLQKAVYALSPSVGRSGDE